MLARFYDGEFSQRAKTRIPAPVSAWNSEDGCLDIPRKTTPETVNLRELQRKLDELNDAVCEAWWRDRFDAGEGWLQQVIDDFHNIPQKSTKKQYRLRLADCVQEYIKAKDLSQSTIGQYLFIVNALQMFEKTHKTTLYADSFNAKNVQAFVDFLTKDSVRSRNTISVKLKKLSAVCHYAVEKGYMKASPFGVGKYKIQGEVYGEPIYLTLAERNYLYEFKDLNPTLAVQRDIFVFQCHIGCRVSDLLELTTENISEDGFLQYIQHKLRKSKPMVVRVPLSDTALEIIERYKGQPDGKLLPFINSQHYNRDIHDIFRIAGLKRVVMVQDPQTLETVPKQLWQVASSHIARRTFMANMFKETKSERITSAFTGHVSGSRAFSRYTSVDDEMKVEVLKNMNERK